MTDQEETDPRLLPGLGSEDFPGFPADFCPPELPDLSKHHSTLADVLKKKPGLYATLRERRTGLGVGLGRCVKVGIDNCGHSMVKTMGIVAGDEECYETFRELFDGTIERHLDIGGPVRHVHPELRGLLDRGLTSTRMDPTARYVICTQARASRCLRGFRFPPAMSRDERMEVERLISRAVLQLPEPLAGRYLPLRGSDTYAPQPGGMSTDDEETLSTAGLLFEAPDSTLQLCSGVGRHWPAGRGVFVNQKECFSVWVNEQDHLRAAATRRDDDLQSAFRQLANGLECIRQSLACGGNEEVFACSDRLGFLTSSPVNLGTAMQVIVKIQLPLLAQHQANTPRSWRAWTTAQGVHIRNVCNYVGTQVTNVFELSNGARLGCSEVQIVNLLVEVVSRLVQMEQRLEAGHPIEDLLAKGVEECLRPQSSGSIWTVRASSNASVNGMAAQELVTGLVQSELQLRMQELEEGDERTTCIEVPDLSVLRLKACEVLVKACDNGSLETALSEVNQFVKHAAQAEGLADLRRQACAVLLQSSENGSLTEALAAVRHLPPPEGKDIAALRVQACNALLQSFENGCLEQALAAEPPPAAPEDGIDLDTVRRRACGLLLESCGTGRLVDVLAEVKKESLLKENTSFFVTLRSRASDVLLQCSLSGRLEAALAEVKRETAQQEAHALELNTLRSRAGDLLLQCSLNGRLEEALVEVKKEAHRSDLGTLRCRAGDLLLQCSHSGRLEEALAEVKKEAEQAVAVKAVDMETLRLRAAHSLFAQVMSGQFKQAMEDEPGNHDAEVEANRSPAFPPSATEVVPVPCVAKRLCKDSPFHKQALALVLQVMSGRDRRIGELTAMIRDTEMRVVQQEQSCKQMQDMVAAAKQDLAHLELDIEWHCHALEGAEGRSAELEAGHRKLIADLDLQLHKGGAPGGSVFSAQGLLTPRPSAGALLEPLRMRR